ncbi:hypothetical protein AB833_25775 [Chromatiales bacterium (ex Bugula neritina AB1)]|nr:hypothetical protein AB833_25775 [Chromatiales bacterium (ex Bugula neritina AB1)]
MKLAKTQWSSDSYLNQIEALITNAQELFKDKLEGYLVSDTPKIESYQRYLTFQYHMTKGVQRYFFRVAASPKLARKRKLRKFFTSFANEEELHYLVAASDLRALDLEILPEPFDVSLWHAYFNSVVDERPFIRIGAALILENIADGCAKPAVKQALSADFMNRDNTKFLVLHQHETLPHGDQLVEAVTSASLSDEDLEDLILGARQGTVFYLRMVDWALGNDTLTLVASDRRSSLGEKESTDILEFSMADLELET